MAARSWPPFMRKLVLWSCGVISPAAGIVVAYTKLGSISGLFGGGGEGTLERWSDFVFPTKAHAVLGLLLPTCAAVAISSQRTPRYSLIAGFALGLSVAWSAVGVFTSLMAALFFPFLIASGDPIALAWLWGAWSAPLCSFAMHSCAARNGDATRRSFAAGCLAGLVAIPTADVAALIWPNAIDARYIPVFHAMAAIFTFIWCVIAGICVAAVSANRDG